jgi:deoxyribonuclease IV
MGHYFGAHPDSGDLIKGAEEIKNSGGNLIQIFVTNKSDSELLEFKNYINKNNMKVVVHSNYMHNLARNWDNYSWWIKSIETEIKQAHLIGASGLVIHFGKKLDLSIEEAYNNMYTSLVYLHNKMIEYDDIVIFLETPTGQGSEICSTLEDLSYFYKKFSKNQNKDIKNRFKLCIDTCHLFAAGYNLKTKKDIKIFLETLEELIGLRYIGLVHLNDSMLDIGEQRDRHDNIGNGYIGFVGLKHIFDYFKKLGVPIILETPNYGFRMEIKMLMGV